MYCLTKKRIRCLIGAVAGTNLLALIMRDSMIYIPAQRRIYSYWIILIVLIDTIVALCCVRAKEWKLAAAFGGAIGLIIFMCFTS